jgi:hypothetical protein
MTLVGKAAAPQSMEQQAVSSKRLRESGWFLATLLLVALFLISVFLAGPS